MSDEKTQRCYSLEVNATKIVELYKVATGKANSEFVQEAIYEKAERDFNKVEDEVAKTAILTKLDARRL